MVVVVCMTSCLTIVPCFVGDRAFSQGAGEVLFRLKRCSWERMRCARSAVGDEQRRASSLWVSTATSLLLSF